MDIKELVKLARSSKMVHRNWYLEQYPDVKILNMEPAEHYLKYGAMMGRNPGKTFDTEFYLNTYPDVKKSGLNPLIHYFLHGEKEGRARTAKSSSSLIKREINAIRKKLYTYGFLEQPLQELNDIIKSGNIHSKTLASRELALWYMRKKTKEGYENCLSLLNECLKEGKKIKIDAEFINKTNLIKLLCLYHLDKKKEGIELIEQLTENKLFTADLYLVASNLFENSDDKISYINKCLNLYNIPPINTQPSSFNESLYDRLGASLPSYRFSRNKNGKVTILIASFNAADTLPTTLRSLQEQTWKNLEILVLDDCSTDNTKEVVNSFSKDDPRIKHVLMRQNGGAYIARNHGLDIATGEFITIHDADDWSHPIKLETQIRFLLENENVIGCTSQQARANTNLSFTRWTGHGSFIITNTSSFMFRKEPVLENLGYWDTVRFSADNEFIRRIQKFFGKEAVQDLPTGPLSFQRDSDTSVVANEFFGINGTLFGARQEYFEAQAYYHENAKSLYNNSNSKDVNFPAPYCMRGKSTLSVDDTLHFDVVIASDFRMPGGSVQSCIEEIRAHRKSGLKTAIMQICRYDLEGTILPEVRKEIDGELVNMIVYGEKVTCDHLIIRYPAVLQHYQRVLPEVKARKISVIINQPPMSDYTENRVVRYSLDKCAENIRKYFGQDATWYPIGPLVRDAINNHHKDELHHIDLSNNDWSNIIDTEEWYSGERTRIQKDKLRIGRHSRDHFVKWPATKEEILSIYPDDNNIEVHILGGAQSPSEIIGYTPKNWIIHDFGALSPKEFLSNIDVFIYFSHPDWVESFGRVIIEAIAAGIPVILPEIYKPLFKESAIYSDYDSAIKIAKHLHDNPKEYNKQVQTALEFSRNNFSYQMHINRLEIPQKKQTKKLIKVAEHSGKTSTNDLKSIPHKPFDGKVDKEKTLYNFSDGNFQYDLLWAPKEGSDRLFILFSGDAMRTKNNPPVFQRWSWSEHFPGHCLYISDPSLHLHPKLGLAWYAGTSTHDPMETIQNIIGKIASQLNIPNKSIISYGSSGGGFAALRLSLFMDGISVITINPQTVITKYSRNAVERYLKICFGGLTQIDALKNFSERLDLVSHAKNGAFSSSKIIYIQNTYDTHHYDEHFKPFLAEVEKHNEGKNFTHILFSHPGGHKKAETPEVFTKAMSIVTES
ncbi:glycosyltransferase [Zobellella sp. DQSA1]|uniref:glycosyltransferase n=1 Tax=Zobellella sp. DQSA1 TaxID=3342386 RepID=UPI0035C07D33